MLVAGHLSSWHWPLMPPPWSSALSSSWCSKSFSDEHEGFSMLVDLYSEVQGCSMTRYVPRGAGAPENPTGIWESHRDRSAKAALHCSAPKRAWPNISTHRDTPVFSAWPWRYRQGSKQAPAPHQWEIMAILGKCQLWVTLALGPTEEMIELPKSANLIHLIRWNFILAIKFTFINSEDRYTRM